MNLINCHAARTRFPKEIFISLESLSLRELTVQILLDLELYRMLKTMRFQGTFSQVKPGVLKLKLFRMQAVIQISKKNHVNLM